jgi:Zn-dependent protease
MPEIISAVITIAIVIFSIVLHEVSHGYAANALGDPTARLQGRLTLNPLSHLDLVGSILVPAITWFSGGFIFGWAKPVPYNPYNLKAGRFSEALVAAAGPATNILLALIFGLLIRLGGTNIPDGLFSVALIVVVANIALAVFNLIPAPPLDGSKILASLLPFSSAQKLRALERYGFIFVLIIILVAWRFITPVIGYLFTLLTGVTF